MLFFSSALYALTVLPPYITMEAYQLAQMSTLLLSSAYRA